MPHNILHAAEQPDARTQLYGLGWNVSDDDQGRLKLDHSGAFALGAATSVALLPVEQLGIVTLTNGEPRGVPEGINNAFFDAAQHGKPAVDWLAYFAKAFAASEAHPPNPYDTPPAQPKPPQATGTYGNSYYSPLTVSDVGGKLQMTMGPAAKPTVFPLTGHDGDTFTFQSIGENASGTSGAVFKPGPDSRSDAVTLTYYDDRGLGTVHPHRLRSAEEPARPVPDCRCEPVARGGTSMIPRPARAEAATTDPDQPDDQRT